jgi:hypothetical protein
MEVDEHGYYDGGTGRDGQNAPERESRSEDDNPNTTVSYEFGRGQQ